MSNFGLDTHKLMYHPNRVSDWLAGKLIYPITMEVSPSGACNQRCSFCALDFMGYREVFLDSAKFKPVLSELSELGIKSIMYAGEGEPFLNEDIPLIIENTYEAGIDVGVVTNGVLLTETLIKRVLPMLTWIRVSLNALTKPTYDSIHRGKDNDYETVMNNLFLLTESKQLLGCDTTIGVQSLLLPENVNEMLQLVEKMRGMGVDYFVVKPYSQHPQSKNKKYESVGYKDYYYIMEKLSKLSSHLFDVVVREESIVEWDEKNKRKYNTCLSLPFWSYIDSEGNVWGCSCFLKDKHFYYGNIYHKTFKQIWNGESRKKSLEWMGRELDVSKCRVNCRLDKSNKYLWELLHNPPHSNFI